MRYLQITEPGQLAYGQKEEPRCGPGQALLRIRRVGICGTDLHAFAGTQPFFAYPRVPGHELAADLVEAEGIPGIPVGSVVTCMPYFFCGHCIACRRGRTNCCSSLQVCGVHRDGGLAEYLTVPASSVLPGQGLGYEALALAEPLAIGAHAAKRAALAKEEWALVVGAGPIGLATMLFAGIAGARVIALDKRKDRLAFSLNQVLAQAAVDPGLGPVPEQLRALTGGDLPTTVFDATGNLAAIQSALDWVDSGGTFVLVGLQGGEIHFSHPEFHRRELTLMSSRNALREDFDQVLESLKKGLIKPADFITHRVHFSQAAAEFPGWIDPLAQVIKAMIDLD
jgi:2-desacetyl-2-hydroxyethyl bacteriochlorophyllide A dehydrogenase